MIKNKKAQTHQVFIYIMVILVVGAVLLFGYKSINKLMNQSCDVDFATFQTHLKTTLEKNSGYGDMAPVSIKSPCQHEKLCFLNSTTENIDKNYIKTINQDIANEITAKTGNNVFLIKGKDTIPLYSLDFIEVPGNNESAKGFLCLDIKSNTFSFNLEGIGKGRVKITQGE